MIQHIRPVAGLLCAWLAQGMAFGQPGEPFVWPYEFLVHHVVAAHPAVESARLHTAQAQAQMAANQSSGSLQFTGFSMPALGGRDVMYWEGQIDHPLTPPALTRARSEVRRTLERLGAAQMASAAQSAQLEVERLVLDWIAADARCTFWVRNLDQTERLRNWFALRSEAGEARSIDLQAAELQMRRADHEFQVAVLQRDEALASLRWLSGQDDLQIDSIAAPPLEMEGFAHEAVLTDRMRRDARLAVSVADSALRASEVVLTKTALRPRPTLGVNVQGVPGDVFAGPLVGLSWPFAGRGSARSAAELAAASSAWDLDVQRRAVRMEAERVWARYAARLAHHAEWSAQIENDQALTSNAVQLIEEGLLDMPTFYALWQAELEGHLELLSCQEDILWLRAQLMLGAPSLNIP
jgi:outer membrane protein TolC